MKPKIIDGVPHFTHECDDCKPAPVRYFKDLGWLNNPADWPQIDQVEKSCRALKHEVIDIDESVPFRGNEHVVKCLTCRYEFHYDSSD